LSTTARTQDSVATADQTSIAYEIGTVNNINMSFVAGTGHNFTADGVFIQTEMTSDGVFETASVPYATELDVGIVVIIVTYDAKGQTSIDRQVALLQSLVDSVQVCVWRRRRRLQAWLYHRHPLHSSADRGSNASTDLQHHAHVFSHRHAGSSPQSSSYSFPNCANACAPCGANIERTLVANAEPNISAHSVDHFRELHFH